MIHVHYILPLDQVVLPMPKSFITTNNSSSYADHLHYASLSFSLNEATGLPSWESIAPLPTTEVSHTT
jgi:hypothetical protein